MLLITHATLYTPDEVLADGGLLIENGRIAALGPSATLVAPPGTPVLDASGLHLTPGFIDLQFNGGFGHDFTADPTTIWQVAAQLPRYGVTAFLPTVITSPLTTIAAAQAVVTQPPAGEPTGAVPLGLHIEGPFLNPQKKGAHNPAYLRSPDVDAVAGWSPVQGVRLVTLAPELPGALDLVELLHDRGILVSAGHSTATYAEATAGFDAGIRYATHLFNAMPPLGHREPGLPGALLSDARPVVGLIVDGVHSHPAMVDLAWKALGNRRLNLVTDAMAALGMPPGKQLLGDFEVWVDETSARLPDGTLAGSILSLDQALRNLLDFTGCTLAEALPTVTRTPAAALGLAHERGSLAVGYRADLVLLDAELQVVATLVDGNVVFASETEVIV
jgi:N-acetylglucosamine-6-phosphate deacetylase